MRLVGLYLDGGSPYCQSPPCGVVLSVLRGVGMASDWTEVTAVPSVLAGLVWHAYPCHSRHARLGLTSPYSSQGSGRRRGRESLARHVAKAEGGVVADPGLGIRPVLLGLAGPRLSRPLLADVPWAAQPAN
jgi:hypothetical protein